jgi:phenylphosphate carboxylase alpha subunit
MPQMRDLRTYIDALRAVGEICEIDQEVDLDLEIGAIIRRCCETGAPAPLFTTIRGHHHGFRILGAPVGTSRQPGRHLVRLAISLGMSPQSTGADIVEAVADSLGKPPIAPVVVEQAPCFENTTTGEAVDLTKLPAPLIHGGDGGRYINTFGCIVARTPDKSWTNWSIARIMALDAKRMTGIVAPEQHIGVVAQTWADIGKPMPFCLALGVEPAIPVFCGMPLPAHVSESDRIGAFLGRPVPTVRCRTVDLEAPASAEILIEGHLHLDKTADEGPMGEYAGYLWRGEAMKRPVYEVTALSYRNNAILPVVAAGEPIEENHTIWGVTSAAEILHELRSVGLPVTMAWVPLQSAIHWLAVTVPKDWRRRSGGDSADAFCRRIGECVFASKAGASVPKIIVLSDDIDPTDLNELVWAFATRCHPTLGNIVFDHADTSPLVAFLRNSEKRSGTTAKVVYNCLPPEEWGDELPIRASFKHGYPQEIIDRVVEQWTSYGFR